MPPEDYGVRPRPAIVVNGYNPKDAGVAVYFTWDGISTCIAVDRYQRIDAGERIAVQELPAYEDEEVPF